MMVWFVVIFEICLVCLFKVGEQVCYVFFELFLWQEVYDDVLIVYLVSVIEVCMLFDLWFVIVYVKLLFGVNEEVVLKVLCINIVFFQCEVVGWFKLCNVVKICFMFDESFDEVSCIDVLFVDLCVWCDIGDGGD